MKTKKIYYTKGFLLVLCLVVLGMGYFYYPKLLLKVTTAQTAPVTPPPSSFPIEGRFVRYGYDATLNVPGDLISAIPGSQTGGSMNGILWALPSRNVVLHPEWNLWELEVGIWNGSSYVWRKTYESTDFTSYYPEPSLASVDSHYWLSGEHGTVVDLGAGTITCYNIDLSLSVPRDLSSGANNGILFALPVRSVHPMVNGSIWHLEMLVQDLDGVQKWKATILPTHLCSFAPSA